MENCDYQGQNADQTLRHVISDHNEQLRAGNEHLNDTCKELLFTAVKIPHPSAGYSKKDGEKEIDDDEESSECFDSTLIISDLPASRPLNKESYEGPEEFEADSEASGLRSFDISESRPQEKEKIMK